MALRLLFRIIVMVLFVPACARAQDVPRVSVSWSPERPVHGTLFRVRVHGAAESARFSGVAAGEPLHFHHTDSVFQAMAAVPIDHGPVLQLTIAIDHGSSRYDTLRIDVPITQGKYALEKLTVAPQFGAPADSATAARIAREQQRALGVSRASHATPRMWDSIVLPREARVTSGYGSGREFNGKVQSRHTGTDFAGAVGAPVRAAARGVVALVDTFYLAGRVIYIDHGEGIVTAYFHLSKQQVAAGDTVEAGQTIGQVGATGRVTGPHLHWVVRYGTISVDPLNFVELVRALRGTALRFDDQPVAGANRPNEKRQAPRERPMTYDSLPAALSMAAMISLIGDRFDSIG
jgi:hypothetical protein